MYVSERTSGIQGDCVTMARKYLGEHCFLYRDISKKKQLTQSPC